MDQINLALVAGTLTTVSAAIFSKAFPRLSSTGLFRSVVVFATVFGLIWWGSSFDASDYQNLDAMVWDASWHVMAVLMIGLGIHGAKRDNTGDIVTDGGTADNGQPADSQAGRPADRRGSETSQYDDAGITQTLAAWDADRVQAAGRGLDGSPAGATGAGHGPIAPGPGEPGDSGAGVPADDRQPAIGSGVPAVGVGA